MSKIFTVSEMIAAEQAADAAGWSYDQMMETAGKAVAEAIAARVDVAGKRILILVGPGNNGGDGLVAGRYLAAAGALVAFYLYKPRDPAEDANLAQVQQMGLDVLDAGADQRYRVLQTRLRGADIVVDALLGTGVSRPIGGELARLLGRVAGSLQARAADAGPAGYPAVDTITVPPAPDRPLVVAVDGPSGLNCDSGALDPLALAADLTVTFAGAKRGHFIFPGAAACGELIVADIGIDPRLPVVRDVALALATPAGIGALLPARPRDGHKGTFGRALIIAGSDRYRGAPILAGRGALRAGAGLVALAVPDVVRATAVTQLPEATYPVVADERDWSAGGGAALAVSAGDYKALLVGPGLGEARAFMAALLADSSGWPPLAVDADGLNALAALPDWPERLPAGTVLTPHPGEMARLMGIELADLVTRDRVEVARAQAAAWGHVVVLKGAFTVVAEPAGAATLIPFANPLLGAAGSGDVLAGIITALLAQGLAPYAAAAAGAYLHGAAGQLAREDFGDVGLLAGEIADYVPRVVARLRG